MATLLLIHPLGGTPRFWDACRTVWETQHHCLTYDWSGAEAVGEDLSLLPNAERIEALRRESGRDVVVVGVAVGAMIAAVYAARHPDHVAGLVLSNPAVVLAPASRGVTEARVERVRKGGIAAILPEVVDRAFNGMPHAADYEKYLAEFAGNDPRAYEKNALAALAMDIGEDLPRIACPTLVIAGEKDILLPPVEAERVAAAIPHAGYVSLAAAHFPPIQMSAAFAARGRPG